MSRAIKWLTKDCFCFASDTPVWTAAGPVPIQDVQVGDDVLATDEKTGELSFRKVLRKYIRSAAPIVVVTVASLASGHETSIRTTEEHPFYVVGSVKNEYPGDLEPVSAALPVGVTFDHTPEAVSSGWRTVGVLRPGMLVDTLDGAARVVRIRFTEEVKPVYNFEIEGVHTYRVGGDGVLVHNSTCKLLALTYDNFRPNLARLRLPPGPDYHAHHLIPHDYSHLFTWLNDPTRNGAWVHSSIHNGSGGLTQQWRTWKRANPNPTAQQVLDFAEDINGRAGIWLLRP